MPLVLHNFTACKLDKEAVETACILAIKPLIFHFKGVFLFFEIQKIPKKRVKSSQENISKVVILSFSFPVLLLDFYFHSNPKIRNKRGKGEYLSIRFARGVLRPSVGRHRGK
ncbi:hypothetical protein V6Z11_A09G151100 [Gossypium hirsutum]|uniref:Uncharacterized protein n=1 Tax=Gossypium tomentosum TaxID=34277 RepID=A0A5D2P2R0_GOSTO|nr:hypothetical protein ES332_A09G152300v1 [Gossypium tomentosum]